MSTSALTSSLEEILEFCEDRYTNIAGKGKQENLTITDDVEKYLIDNILSESLNTFVYEKLNTMVIGKGRNISTDIGLWATPATWTAKYPNVKLALFEAKNLAELFSSGITVLSNKFEGLIKGVTD
jgi:hypothetical protein